MVLFAFLLFVLLKLYLYKFLISSTSFFTSSIIFITNKLLEFQLRGGKNCAFDSIVIQARNQKFAMGGTGAGLGAELQAFENFAFFLQK